MNERKPLLAGLMKREPTPPLYPEWGPVAPAGAAALALAAAWAAGAAAAGGEDGTSLAAVMEMESWAPFPGGALGGLGGTGWAVCQLAELYVGNNPLGAEGVAHLAEAGAFRSHRTTSSTAKCTGARHVMHLIVYRC